jgi:hypothetical protein
MLQVQEPRISEGLREGGCVKKVDIYERLFLINKGFEDVLRNLRALQRLPPFGKADITRFEELSKEARAATNSYLTELLGRVETDEAGRLFRTRLVREREEERQ